MTENVTIDADGGSVWLYVQGTAGAITKNVDMMTDQGVGFEEADVVAGTIEGKRIHVVESLSPEEAEELAKELLAHSHGGER